MYDIKNNFNSKIYNNDYVNVYGLDIKHEHGYEVDISYIIIDLINIIVELYFHKK